MIKNRAWAEWECHEKTSVGNLFYKKCHAEKAARQTRRRVTEDPVQAYHCPICGWWHLGKVILPRVKIRYRDSRKRTGHEDGEMCHTG